MTARANRELIEKSQKALRSETDPVEKLRLFCLSRGATGISGIGRQFRILDDDNSHTIDFSEFSKGCDDFGAQLTAEEKKQAFAAFDTDGSGSLSFDEFLVKLRPPLNNARKSLIMAAFNKLDKDHSGQITAADLKGVYDVRHHPKYRNGQWTEEQCFNEFLKTFEVGGNVDGIVTKEEFMNYYTALSASIDSDVYFDLMMRQVWKL